jgi:hypothetical protein
MSFRSRQRRKLDLVRFWIASFRRRIVSSEGRRVLRRRSKQVSFGGARDGATAKCAMGPQLQLDQVDAAISLYKVTVAA